ncbi:hypothetical protein KHA80_05885 [Anaerobacillus sp. HL2]|nr:hypothetical protein KHA80_05885 [Anaerobacillus sp. HL2]
MPEKVVVDELEGMEEESNVSLQEGKSGYVIYFDKGMYSMIQVEEGKIELFSIRSLAIGILKCTWKSNK